MSTLEPSTSVQYFGKMTARFSDGQIFKVVIWDRLERKTNSLHIQNGRKRPQKKTRMDKKWDIAGLC